MGEAEKSRSQSWELFLETTGSRREGDRSPLFLEALRSARGGGGGAGWLVGEQRGEMGKGGGQRGATPVSPSSPLPAARPLAFVL